MEKKKKYESPLTLVFTTTQTILAASQSPDAGAKDMPIDSSWDEDDSGTLNISNSSDEED